MHPGRLASRDIKTEESPIFVGWIEVAAERGGQGLARKPVQRHGVNDSNFMEDVKSQR